MRKVSIIIPTKDEPYIQTLVKRINEIVSVKHEIIVVDKSKYLPKVRGAKVVKQKSDGLGKAFLEGLKIAEGDVIVLMDGDGSHRPEDLPRLLEKVKDYDIVIGSKYVKGGRSRDKIHRILISRFYSFLASFLLGLNIKDSMSGFSVVKRDVYNKIKLNPLGFKVNTELLFKAKKLGFKVAEVPITFESRKMGKPKGNLREGIKTLKFIFELKLGFR